MALPPPPPALFLPSRASPQSRHQVIVTNRSPSPSTSSISKFAQVRDIFARAEAAASSSSNSHHHYHPPPPLHHQQIPIKNSTQNSHQVPPIERARSPKSGTVLDIVQEYQRQYINNHQPAYKRFAHLGGGNPNRPLSFNGNSHIKPRGIGSFITNNINNKSLLQNKQPPTVPSNFITSSSKQPAKPITRVIIVFFLFKIISRAKNKFSFQVLLMNRIFSNEQ